MLKLINKCLMKRVIVMFYYAVSIVLLVVATMYLVGRGITGKTDVSVVVIISMYFMFIAGLFFRLLVLMVKQEGSKI